MSSRLEYINSRGEVIDLRSYDTQIYTGGFHSYAWDYDGIEQQYGSKIERFRKSALEYSMQTAFRGPQAAENLNRFFEITEYDVISQTPGRLWWKDYFLECYIVSSNTMPSDEFFGAVRESAILAPYPFWIKEKTRRFIAGDIVPEQDLDYAHDYPYDYTSASRGNINWDTDHFAPSEFLMRIYGPCVDPKVNINGHIYTVFDTLDASDYIEINSLKQTVIKHRSNGTKTNLFDMRGVQQSVFEPIPGGVINVNWSGDFGFDITLYEKRSEPQW